MKQKSFALMDVPEPAMSRDIYAELASEELRLLLENGECDEKKFQSLLEDHPTLVSGVYPSIKAGHNGIFPAGVITQPPLTGLVAKVPVFCIISWDSGTLHITLVEIESPCKKWATASGQQRSELTQAIGQIRDWKNWFSDSSNTARFLDEYKIPDNIRSHRALANHYVLVYGRRADFQSSNFAKRRARAQQTDEVFMTWDRLLASTHYSELLTVRLTPRGYQAVRVPPTVTLGPWYADYHALLQNRNAAIDASKHLSPTRAAFLKARWPYWDAWQNTHGTIGFEPISSEDHE